ncbi:MAG: hypothetical protein F4X08_08190 [Gemmatimonadetes bacterium]|nr:hypothetical protein [Gemmatimonadota bacterium]MYI99673.1 hypothetical protein [Gemmatimonadota bacterium]
MNKKWVFALLPVALLIKLGLALWVYWVTVLAVWFLWPWVVPELLPGFVSQEMIVGSLSWITSMKVAIVIVLIGLGIRLAVSRLGEPDFGESD